MMRVLVTGASGFVGRHLVPALVDGGHVVRATCRPGRRAPLGTGAAEWTPLHDITSETEWAVAVRGVDAVVHLAGLAHQIGPGAETRESEFQRVNARGTERLAEASRRAGVRRVVMVSSIAVLGPYQGTPFTEASPCAPDTAYGRSKLEGESAIRRLLAEGETDWCILRPPLVYGPGNPGNMARLLRLIQRGLPLPLGRIEASRSYIYVGNLTDLLVRCLTHPAASRRIFVVDDGEPVATQTLIRLLAGYAGKAACLVPVWPWVLRALGRAGDHLQGLLGRSVGFDSYAIDRLMGSLVIDSRAVQSALEWTPPYRQEAGLRSTVQTALEAT
ncbi:MAG: NAD-dependent epimerase/dehydratase family protein [Gemmatimonadota bacterium]|nr:NAD-dependent epimerase/dehydratase family protein [Gemmatimonadota bacterium]